MNARSVLHAAPRVHSLGARFVLMTVLAVCAAVLASVVTGALVASRLIDAAEQRELRSTMGELRSAIDAQSDEAVALARFVAGSPRAQELVAAADTQGLLEEFAGSWASLAAANQVSQFQFHLPPATSLARLHQPDSFGDDLSAVRQTVVQANATRMPVVGIESGVFGLGIRGVVPVSHEGTHVGSVEFGMSLGQPFFDAFSDVTGADAALFVPGQRDRFDELASTMAGEPIVGSAELAEVYAGEATRVRFDRSGRTIAAVLEPLDDFAGEPIGVVMVAVDVSELTAMGVSGRNLTILVGLGVLIVAALLASVGARRISRSTAQIDRLGRALAERDLNVSIDDPGDDEIGAAAAVISTAVGELRDVMGEVWTSSHSLSGSAEGLSSVAAQMSTMAEETSAQSELVAASAEEVGANLATVAASSEEMTASIQEIAANASEASLLASGAAERSTLAASLVERLADACDSVGEVTELISAITNKTHMLALNATIEAARAGDAGRGFWVVADEVKALAEQTAGATDQISERIETIRADARAAVAAVLEVTEAIGEIDTLQSTIASSVEEQSMTTAEIGRNVHEAAIGASQISENIVGIAHAARDGAGAAGSTLAAVHELYRMAASLTAVVQTFTVDAPASVDAPQIGAEAADRLELTPAT